MLNECLLEKQNYLNLLNHETQPEIKKKNPVSALTSNLTPPSVTQDVGERRGVERPNDFTRSFSQTADQYNKGKAHDEEAELKDVASCNDDSSSGCYSQSSENESNVMKVEGQNINIFERKFSSHYQFGPAEDKEIDDVVLQDYIPIQTSLILGDWPSTVKLGRCEIKFPAGAVDKCTMVAFTLVYVNKNEDKNPRKVFVSPTLTCLPHSEFKKPVSITLPTCYSSFRKEMPVTIVADKENDWMELQQMRCTSYLITFETKSLSRLKAVANKADIVTKSLLFKLLLSNKGATDHLINCKILDGLADVTDDEPKSYFKFDVKRNQNVALTLQCDSVVFQPEEVKIQWEEVFGENVDISKKINFVTTCDSVALDQIAITIKDEANEEIVQTFGLPFPTLCKALPDVSMLDHTDETKLSENSMNTYTPLQTSTIVGDWPSTVKLGECEIKFPPGAVDKCTMVAFTLTYSDKDDDKDSEEVTVTPILTCLPDMHFKRPVIITLPSCYNSFEDDMPVTVMTEKGKTWTELCEEKCTDNWVTFETESFSGKKVQAKRSNVGKKLMCFKFSRSAKRSADAIIECKIVDDFVDTSDEDPQDFFKLKVNKDEDLKLTFQCENAKVESRVVYSEEIFRESSVILTEFKFIKKNDLGFGAVTFKVKSETTKKKLRHFRIPPKFLLAQDENIDDTIEKIKVVKVEELNVLHAIRKHYDDHIGNDKIYQIRLKPKGRALILSNAKFSWTPPDEEAEAKFIAKSNEECSLMKKLFEGLGCEVKVQRNKSAEEMLDDVQRFATRSDHTNYSILFVMTHGAKISSDNQSGTSENEVLVGCDQAYIKSRDIVEMFCADKVNNNLINKPRLIFFQSCRGVAAASEGFKYVSQNPSTPEGLRIGTEEAHMLIARSTTEGFPAFQRWFTDAIAWYFSQHAKDTEIMPLLREVRNYVSQRTSKSSSRPKLDGKKQCPIDITLLSKGLYFFPGISPD